jgi:hypothetical protein
LNSRPGLTQTTWRVWESTPAEAIATIQTLHRGGIAILEYLLPHGAVPDEEMPLAHQDDDAETILMGQPPDLETHLYWKFLVIALASVPVHVS